MKMYDNGGREGYGLGDLVKKKLRRYTREGIDEAQEEWLRKKGLDLTLEEWKAKSLLEKLKIAGKLNLTMIPGVDDLEKGTDYASGGIAGELHLNRQGYQWGGPGGYSPGTPIDYQPKSKPIKSPIFEVYKEDDIIGIGEEGITKPKEFIQLPEKLQEKKETDISEQKKDWKRKDYMAWNKYQKGYDELTSDEKSAIEWEMVQQDFAAYESSLSGKIFDKEPPPMQEGQAFEETKQLSVAMDLMGITSEIQLLHPKRKIETVGDLKKLINDAVTKQTISYKDAVKFTNTIDGAKNSMEITSSTPLADITHFVDSGMSKVRASHNIGPVELTSSYTFKDGKLTEGGKTTFNFPIDISKQLFARYDDLTGNKPGKGEFEYNPLKIKGGISSDNLENLYANLGVDYNVGDLELGFTSGISSQDKKKLIANIGLNKDFESGLGSGILTPSLSYDILNKEPKLDIGYQHEFDETIPYVGDGTLKIGGELDKSGQNYGIVFKKKLKSKPKILGKYAEGGRVSFTKGGLANILKV